MITDPRLDLKLFLEGDESSVITASVSTTVRSSATITVLATRPVRKLKPMTNVVLGYRDVEGSDPGLVSQEGVRYSVLFVGMVVGISLSRTPSNRSATLQCEGHQTLLDRHYTYISNTPQQLFDHKQSFFGAASFFNSTLKKAGLAEQVKAVFEDTSPPVTPGLGGLSGPPKGIIKLIERCVGTTLPTGAPAENKHGAQHEFFAHASQQCRLLYQIGGISADTGVTSLLGKDTAGAAISNMSSNLPEIATLNTVMDVLLKQMYYSFVSIGAPPAHKTVDTGVSVARTSALNALVVLFYHDVEAKLVPGASVPDSLAICDFKRVSALEGELRTHIETDLTVPSTAFKKHIVELGLSQADVTLLYDATNTHLSELVKFKREGKELSYEEALAGRASILSLLRKTASKQPAPTNADQAHFMRVLSYLVLPDLAFCTPPSCNVLFPSQISSFSMNIPKFNLPTRLLLHAQMVPNGEENKGGYKGYYAPSVKHLSDVQGGSARDTRHAIPLFKHEYFTGIVPSFASFSFFEKFRTASDKDPDMLLRVANYNLVRQRYQPVTLAVSGPFNPFVAVGFPIALLDVDDVTKEAPSVYVGSLSNLTHVYDSSGSSMTSYSITHVREVDEIDALFEDDQLRVRTGDAFKVVVTRQDFPGDSEALGNALREFIKVSIGEKNKVSKEDNLPFLPVGDIYALARGCASSTAIAGVGSVEVPTNCTVATVTQHVSSLTKSSTYAGHRIAAVAWDGLTGGDPAFVNAWVDEIKNLKPENIPTFIAEHPYKTDLGEHLLAMLNFLETLDQKSPANEDALARVGELLENLGAIAVRLDQVSDCTTRVFSKGETVSDIIALDVKISHVGKEYTVSLAQFLLIDQERLLEETLAGKFTFFVGRVSLGDAPHESANVFIETPVGPPSPEAVPSDTPTNVALEEVYRPPWFSDNYSIKNIGDKLYFPILKCGSVQDLVPPEEPHDTTVNVDGDAMQTTYSTRKSLLHAYRGYLSLQDPALRDRYVSTYVRRPVANVLDVIEEYGLLKTPLAEPLVVDHKKLCPPGTDQDHITPAHTTTHMSVEGDKLIDEKQSLVKTYITSTKGDAFT